FLNNFKQSVESDFYLNNKINFVLYSTILTVMLGLEAWPRPRGQNLRPRPRPRPRPRVSWPRPRPRPRGSGLDLESRGRGQSRGHDKIQCHKYKAIDYN